MNMLYTCANLKFLDFCFIIIYRDLPLHHSSIMFHNMTLIDDILGK